MAKVKINKDKCKGCYLCVVNCPNGCIKIAAELNMKGIKPVFFSSTKCTGCGLCATMCPDCGILIYK
ncbi:MAG: 4Fe-4S binding protein [Candidatus Omnitrophota bacterium]|nr:4Fe-4S binding protein [Candidatus Omnitrophota bacterium]